MDRTARIRAALACALVFATLIASLLAPAAAFAVAPVEFKDANLEAAVRTALGIPAPDPIMPEDMLKLTLLDVTDQSVGSLDGLQYASHLATLSAGGNPVDDLSPLASLTELTVLDVHGAQISDLSPLRESHALMMLDLSGNSISDISALSELTSLRALLLADNDISDISALKPLDGLGILNLSANDVSDVSDLASLGNLVWLWLDGNRITDVRPLAELGSIWILHLENNRITGISPLVNGSVLRPIDAVFLQGNYLDLRAGSDDLADINTLVARMVSVTYTPQNVAFADADLEAAVRAELSIPDTRTVTQTDMQALTTLSANGSGISDLEGLQYATGLQLLSANSNAISDLTPLRDLDQLTDIHVRANRITNLAPLSGLDQLHYLDASSNAIADLSPLAGLPALYYLSLHDNQITDLSGLIANTNLAGAGLGIRIDHNYLDLTPGSQDMAAIMELVGREISVTYEPQNVDATPPSTTISSLPAGWVTHNVAFSLASTDTQTFLGTVSFYQLNGSMPATYSTAVTVAAEGVTTIEYFSRDGAGNTESPHTAAVRIDRTAPVTADDHSAIYGGTATVHLAALDSASGVASTRWVLDGVESSGNAASTSVLGGHTLAYRSTDNVGNAEATRTVTFSVVPLYSTKLSLSGRSAVKRKKTLTVTARISPKAAPGSIRLAFQRRVAGKWRTMKSAKARPSGGAATCKYRPGYRGSWRVHASYAGATTTGAMYLAANAVRSFKVR